jgi:hypothetical protein
MEKKRRGVCYWRGKETNWMVWWSRRVELGKKLKKVTVVRKRRAS